MLIEISKMINGLMSYLKTTEIKGSKFMEDVAPYGISSVKTLNFPTLNFKLKY